MTVYKYILLLFFLSTFFGCANRKAGGEDRPVSENLTIEILGKEYLPEEPKVVVSQRAFSKGGSTSVRNVDQANLEWKSQGYYQRNRDLGQVFLATDDYELASIVLRTGPSDKAVLEGAPGAPVFVQFFEVDGEPEINDNGTPAGTKAKHGFSDVHRCDDFIENISYTPMDRLYYGIFPEIPVTFSNGEPTEGEEGRLVYMRWRLKDPLQLRKGRRYAFMIGFAEPGNARGFTLANANAAGIDAPPSLNDSHDAYPAGWSLRREGDGTLPPSMSPMANPPATEDAGDGFTVQSLFPAGKDRYLLQPVTDGYPDVDTYRDLEFTIEKK